MAAMPTMKVSTALTALALIGAGLGVGYLIGYSREGHYSLTNASFDMEGPGGEATLGEFKFQKYGRYSTQGKVVRIWTEPQFADVPALLRILVVSDSAHSVHGHGAYEVSQEHGVFQVHVRGVPKKFSVLTVLNKDAIAGVLIDDEVTIAGDYGEIHYRDGSTCSLADLGLFVGTVQNVKRANPFSPTSAP